MPDDRLRHDHDDVENLDDLIEARDDSTSHFARDIDAADRDIDIPEDIDVDEALTFPHPKRKKNLYEDIELMDTPRKDDIDIDWIESQDDMLPSDYEDDYDDVLTTNLYDEDTVAEEQMEELSHPDTDVFIYEYETPTPASKGFKADEETGADVVSLRETQVEDTGYDDD